jgi:signal transduction histidine kinase
MEVQLRQAQKLEAVGQLAAGIAHEINTPTQYISDNVRFLEEAFKSLAGILKEEGDLLEAASTDPALAGRIEVIRELMRREDLDYLLGEVPRAIQQSLEGLTRVSSIVKAMKIFSHPGVAGRVVVDLNQCVETTCIVARNEWKYVALLETDLAPGLPRITCYPGEVNQMILNLIINAAHAIEATLGGSGGKGAIRVRTFRDADWAVLEVEDTGTGIPKLIRDQIFLPFFTTKPVGKGTGQGLAIVHSVAAKHGGTVTFESEEGKGTTFTVKLPISAQD